MIRRETLLSSHCCLGICFPPFSRPLNKNLFNCNFNFNNNNYIFNNTYNLYHVNYNYIPPNLPPHHLHCFLQSGILPFFLFFSPRLLLLNPLLRMNLLLLMILMIFSSFKLMKKRWLGFLLSRKLNMF